MADAGSEQSGEDSDCDGPDRVVREWRSVLRDDGVACSGYGESRYPDVQRTEDDRQWIGTACQTRQDIVVEHPRETTVTAAWLSRIPLFFCSVACFFYDSLRVTWMFL